MGQTILVLGGYGFIGSAVLRHLRGAGHEVICFGRDPAVAGRVLPNVSFRQGELCAMTEVADWSAPLAGVDLVVNCAGAIQDQVPGELDAVHHRSIAALGQA